MRKNEIRSTRELLWWQPCFWISTTTESTNLLSSFKGLSKCCFHIPRSLVKRLSTLPWFCTAVSIPRASLSPDGVFSRKKPVCCLYSSMFCQVPCCSITVHASYRPVLQNLSALVVEPIILPAPFRVPDGDLGCFVDSLETSVAQGCKGATVGTEHSL